MTKIQTSILNSIVHANGHRTAEQVLAVVKNQHPSASLSTVYRNLNLFATSGKIRRIRMASGADFYDKNMSPHDHAFCVQCGNMMDIKIQDLKRFLERDFEYPILSFDLLLRYICPECKEKQ